MEPASAEGLRAGGGRVICRTATIATVLFGAIGISVSTAQTFPARPIKLIVATAPGGPPDITGRILAQKLSEGMDQQVIVENRAGAGGTIGSEEVAKAKPDGYTLLFGTTGTLAGAPNLYSNLGYDPVRSFAPISLVSIAPLLIVIHPSVPAASLREFIEFAKARPGRINAGSAGNGTPPHIAVEMFKTLAGIDLVHIPYKGSGAGVLGLIAGDVQVYIEQFNGALQQAVRAGKLRALAIASSKRHALLPNVPTAAEAGLPGYEVSGWTGVLAPRGTAPEVIRQLNGEVLKALATKEVRDTLANQGIAPAGSTPQQFSAFIAEEIAKWSRAIKASGAKVD